MREQYKQEDKEKLRLPHRPLQAVSFFVCDKMPQFLESVRNGSMDSRTYTDIVESVVESLPLEIEDTLHTQEDLLLSRIDAVFLEHSVVHSGMTVPTRLKELVTTLSKKSARIPGILYEDLIFTNPTDDLRTFTTGEIGEAERFFYLGHKAIEEKLGEAVSIAFNLLYAKNLMPIVLSQQLEKIAGLMLQAQSHMKDFSTQLKPEHFQTFARYHEKNPYRSETKSAGGQFSSSIPTLELLLSSSDIPTHVMEHWNTNLPYFPVFGQEEFLKAVSLGDSGKSIKELVKQNLDLDVVNAYATIDAKIRAFRGQHYKAVSTHIPEVVEKGMPTQEFLQTRIKISHV